MHFVRKPRIQNSLRVKDRYTGKIFSSLCLLPFSKSNNFCRFHPPPAQKCCENIVYNLESFKSTWELRFLLHCLKKKIGGTNFDSISPHQRNSQKLTGCSFFNAACTNVYMHIQTTCLCVCANTHM